MYTDDPPPYNVAISDSHEYSADNTRPASDDINDSVEGSEISSTLETGFTTLSAEIIAEILLRVCTLTQNEDHDLHLEPQYRWVWDNHPLSLASVCRVWRDIICSTSEFWKTVILRLPRNKDRFPVEILQDWLNRAKGRPLDIFVYCPPTSVPREMRYMQEALALLAEHFEQRRCIEAHLPLVWSQHLFMECSMRTSEGPISRLPLLQKAVLDYKMDHLLHIPDAQLPNFTQVKSLRHLSLLGVRLTGSDPLPRINIKRVTTLTLHDIANIPLLSLLNLDRCPQLTNLTILNSRVEYRSSFTRMVHDKLQTLTIDLVDYRSLDRLFEHISFPNLKSLSVHSHQALLYTYCILPFLKASECNLTKLSLKCRIDLKYEFDLIELLSDDSISPSLQELYIEDYEPPQNGEPNPPKVFDTGLGPTFFENLHPDRDPSYLPQLEHIEHNGPLAVLDIDFLEPLVIRSKIRDRLASSGEFLATRSDFDSQMATLRRVVIKGNQYSEETQFTVSEYSDPHFVWEIISLMDEDVFSLRNQDGSIWL